MKLSAGLAKSHDFEEVRILHDRYLESILEQCFLNLPDVLKSLQDVLLMCTKLCFLLQNIDEDSIKDAQFSEQLVTIKHNFEKQSNRVFQLLSNFKNNH